MMHERRFPGGPDMLRGQHRIEMLEPERVVDLCLRDIRAGSVLDVGTGSGLFAEAFARRGLSVVGLDVRPKMVRAAREQVPAGRFQVGLAEALPYCDGAYDLVFMGLVLHEADNRLEALKEARRVGRLRFAALEWPHQEQPMGPPLWHRLKPKAVQQLAQEAGFRNVHQLRLEPALLYLLTP